MRSNNQHETLFAGVIGQEYNLLKQLSPLAAEMSRLVGVTIADFPAAQEQPLHILELGGGTGITTLSILCARTNLKILSVDNEPVMQNQAKQSLQSWVEQDQLTFSSQDALSALQALPDASFDIVASAYTLHNFLNCYRNDVIIECFRVLKPGGQLINADRYALDDPSTHTRLVQEELSNWFKVLIPMHKADVLEHWIAHLLSDESENHIMRERPALEQLQAAGFKDIQVQRQQVNALVTAYKPL